MMEGKPSSRWQMSLCFVFRAIIKCLVMLLMLTGSKDLALAQPTDDLIDEHVVIQEALRPVKADLDMILERRLLRVAIPYSPIYFSYNGDKVIGFAVEMAREFEAYLGATLDKKIDILLVPLPRDQIIPAVTEGRADLAMANLTITEERRELVDFADPIFKDISEIVVTGSAAPEPQSFDDLVEEGVFLRPSSSYYAHMQHLNGTREAAGRATIPITEVVSDLEDYDLLDLLNNGVITATVVDSHKLELWRQVFENIRIHQNLFLNEGGEIAWAIRKASPDLLEVVNGFIAQAKQGTLLGNILSKRYFGSAGWIEEIRTGERLRGREEIIRHIRDYSSEYGFDWRLIFAQAYQESRLDQNEVSDAGAVGVMQILPATASDRNVAIPEIGNLEDNVHAGIKYLDFIRSRYFDAPGISAHDKIFLSLAAYNAGPRRISEARKQAGRMGLDPNVWFSNVEIATAKLVGVEPVVYVRNIYKNFVSFGLISRKAAATTELRLPQKGRSATDDPNTLIWTLISISLSLLFIGIGFFTLRRFVRR